MKKHKIAICKKQLELEVDCFVHVYPTDKKLAKTIIKDAKELYGKNSFEAYRIKDAVETRLQLMNETIDDICNREFGNYHNHSPWVFGVGTKRGE